MKQLDLKLRPYQAEGVRHLLRQPFGGLLMDPGTGKTLTLLTAFHELKRRGLIDRLLVMAPMQVMYEVWPAEIEKWGFPYKVAVLHGDKKRTELDRADDECDVWLINYHGLHWLYDVVPWEYWKEKRWWLVCDESTAIKHTQTNRFKVLKENLPLYARRTILTGTPAPNGFEDLFGQVMFCDLGKRLGRFITQYRRNYFFLIDQSFELKPGAEEQVWKTLDGLFYRVSDDVLGLPPVHRVRHNIKLPAKARDMYDQLEADFIVKLSEVRKISAVNAGVLSSKLRQASNGAVYDDDRATVVVHNEKLDAVESLLGELAGNPLLLGFEFKHDGWRINEWFDCPIVDGDTPRKIAKETWRRFNNGELPLLACQAAVAARGLNLQRSCHHVAEYGQMWDLEIREQFYKRVHRSGQTKTVFLHEFLAKDTIEVDVHREVISGKGSKKQRQDRLLRAIKERYLS